MLKNILGLAYLIRGMLAQIQCRVIQDHVLDHREQKEHPGVKAFSGFFFVEIEGMHFNPASEIPSTQPNIFSDTSTTTSPA